MVGIHESHTPIRILHQSFRDFIVERAVAGQRYKVDTEKDHERMARRCFEIMNAELSNVGDLGRILSLEEIDPYPKGMSLSTYDTLVDVLMCMLVWFVLRRKNWKYLFEGLLTGK